MPTVATSITKQIHIAMAKATRIGCMEEHELLRFTGLGPFPIVHPDGIWHDLVEHDGDFSLPGELRSWGRAALWATEEHIRHDVLIHAILQKHNNRPEHSLAAFTVPLPPPTEPIAPSDTARIIADVSGRVAWERPADVEKVAAYVQQGMESWKDLDSATLLSLRLSLRYAFLLAWQKHGDGLYTVFADLLTAKHWVDFVRPGSLVLPPPNTP